MWAGRLRTARLSASLALWAIALQWPIGAFAGSSEKRFPTAPVPKVIAKKEMPELLDTAKWQVSGTFAKLAVSDRTAPGAKTNAMRLEVTRGRKGRKRLVLWTSQVYDFKPPQDWSKHNRLVLRVYVEPSETPRGATISIYLPDSKGEWRRNHRGLGPLTAPRGKWVDLVWDITPIERKEVAKLRLGQGSYGVNPGESDEDVFHIGAVELWRMDLRTRLIGWDVLPRRVAFSHVGYPVGAQKTAIFPGDVTCRARLVGPETGDKVFWEGKLTPAGHPRTGRFSVADFSEFRRPGRYVLIGGEGEKAVATEPFVIGKDVYREAVLRTFDYYFAERCGVEVPGYHKVCHLDDGIVRPYSKKTPPERYAPEVRAIFGKHVSCPGGWHDAGDTTKYPYQEYNSAYQMCRLYGRGLRYPRQDMKRDGVLDEAIWGVDYALKTLLPTGRNCDRADRVTPNRWTDNKSGTDDDRELHMTLWYAVHRYITAVSAEAAAARLVKDADPGLADRCLKQARLEAEAYLTGAEKDWRAHEECLKHGSVGLAFLEMYRATGDERFKKEAVRCGDDLVGLQEQGLAWNDKGITGFWYRSRKARHPHGGTQGDGRHVHVLCELCREFPDHPSWMTWYAAVKIHVEFFALATSKYSTPYGLPAYCLHDGPKQPRMWWFFKRHDFQFDRLMRVGSRYLMRIFTTNRWLPMTAAALAAAADVGNDPRAEAMAHRCFQWILGRNPFSRSQQWEVGHRFREQPHFVFMHGEMPGALAARGMCGIRRWGTDAKYLDVPCTDCLPHVALNEVCLTATDQYLTAGVELAFSPTLSGVVRGKEVPREVVAGFDDGREVLARAPVNERGEYRLTLPSGGTYTIACGRLKRRVFVASAANRKGFDLHTEREVDVSLECPSEVPFGAPFKVTVRVRRLGQGADADHVLALRLHNLNCARPGETVNLAGKDEATVEFELVPQRPSEPFLVLVVPDGELHKRAEAIGVVGRKK